MPVMVLGDEAFLPLFEMCEGLGATATSGAIELNGITITVSEESVISTSGEAKPVPVRRIRGDNSPGVFADMRFFTQTLGCMIVIHKL